MDLCVYRSDKQIRIERSTEEKEEKSKKEKTRKIGRKALEKKIKNIKDEGKEITEGGEWQELERQ